MGHGFDFRLFFGKNDKDGFDWLLGRISMQRSSLLTFCVCSVGIFSIMTAVLLLRSLKNLPVRRVQLD